MSGVTDPAEEYFKDGLWAWVTDQWKKLVADASNFLKINIAAQDIDVEVKQQTAADLTPGVMGWDGSAWRKLPILWGYSDNYVGYEQATAAADGDVTLTFSTVPAGECWVITHVNALCATNNPSLIQLYPYITGGVRVLSSRAYTTAPETLDWNGTIYLKAGDRIGLRFKACLTGDFVLGYAHGYKMKVAE